MAQITKDMLKEFRQDFTQAVKSLNEKYNIDISLGSISFDNYHFTTKLEAKSLDKDNLKNLQDNQNAILKAMGATFVIGDKIKSQNKLFTVIGINPRAPKQPIEIADEFGKKYKCSIAAANKFIYKPQANIKK